MKIGWKFDRILLFGPIAIMVLIAILAVALPGIFWDGFIFRYYWGPIVADAGGDAGGLTPDYNWVDTISYGLILAWASYLLFRRFTVLNLRTGAAFFVAMMPIIAFGPAGRVLEDMELFNEPLQYIFISPVIYIFLGIATLLTIEIAVEVQNMKGWDGDVTASLLILLPGLLTSLSIVAFPGWYNADIPVIAILGISAAMAVLYPFIFRRRSYESLVGWTWTTVLLFAVVAFITWFAEPSFKEHYLSMAMNGPIEQHLGGGAIIVGSVALSTGIVIGSTYLLSRKFRLIRSLLNPINGIIISGHMLDASATFVGVDFYGYSEKHRLPSLLMDATGTAFVMYPLKLVFLLPALYFIDRSLSEGEEKNPHLLAMVRLAIMVLGFGPGARDLLRLTLGV